jgi:cell division protein FtsB
LYERVKYTTKKKKTHCRRINLQKKIIRENGTSLRLCLGVGFWRGREGKERLWKRSIFVWEFLKK